MSPCLTIADVDLEPDPEGVGSEVTRTYAVITTEANAVARQVHTRMPALLEAVDWPLWLRDEEGDAATLMRPVADDVIRNWRRQHQVNSVRNNIADDPAFPGRHIARAYTADYHRGV